MNREKIKAVTINNAINMLEKGLAAQLFKKGDGSFVSSHEVLGVVGEEYFELVDAVRSNRIDRIKDELLDIAVACVFAVACIEQDSLEW